MFLIRPIKHNDLDGLMKLLENSGYGLTSLPKDPDVLKRKIAHSEKSFEHDQYADGPAGQSYLFVMEETSTRRIVGVSGIIAKIGGFDPVYFYKLKSHQHKSKSLNVENEIKSLHVDKTHSGPTEICSLFLDPEFRNSQNGRFLSLSRFLFMADNRKYFENEVIAEMRGRVDDEGNSPFWEAVGKHFFKIDFSTADYLLMKNKKFIEELLPKYPIVVNLLPEAAQEVVAEVHPHTVPARKILEQEGFDFSGWVGIFEPGPVLIANLDTVRAIQESQIQQVSETKPAKEINSEMHIISRTDNEFKACLSPIELTNKGLIIGQEAADTLQIKIGESIRFVGLRPKDTSQRKMTSKKKVNS